MAGGISAASAGESRPAVVSAAESAQAPRKAAAKVDNREKFLPVTRQALYDRLTLPALWPRGQAQEAKRFFRYLDAWRHQTYVARLLDLERTYEPFSPDSDLLITRTYGESERIAMQKQLVEQVRTLLIQANFTEIHPSQVEILSQGSFYGLDLQVDLSVFDEVVIFSRGSIERKEVRRKARSLFLRKEEFDLPVFQRLCVLFKLKPFDVRVREVMAQTNFDRPRAERAVLRLRSMLPPGTSSDYVYLKLFKNIPHTDLEMVFPNTRIRFRPADKVKFGVTAGSGLGVGVAGAVSKLAAAATLTPFGMAGAAVAFGGVALRQFTNFLGQRNKYIMKMAQNLYFHSMADNRGVLTLLADRAADEDIKEEMLLYSVLAKQSATVYDLEDIDRAIERYLKVTFGVDADFDIDDALQRLLQEGIVRQTSDGRLETLPPALAAKHVDSLWDSYLDNLPVDEFERGQEVEKTNNEDAAGA